MAAYAALLSLLNIIEQIKIHPRMSTSLDNKQIESLCHKVNFLLDFIERYSSHGGSEEADDLEWRIASAAYEAEDAIESPIVDQIEAENTPTFLPDLQKIMEDMDSIKERVFTAKEERGLNDQQPSCSTIPPTSSRPQTRMVGFDDKLIQIMDVLTGQQSSRQIISVSGMGGIGKSTLAKNVYENPLIVQHFDVRAWTTISQQYSVRKILIDLLSSIEKATSETVEKLGEQLHKSLWGRRYLIVLDDMWSIEVWDKIRFFFPDNNNGSRIVLTTRVWNVANQCSSVYFRMEFLDEDKSWILFCESVFGREDCPPELEGVGREISQLCKGLPLSIVVIGGLLRRSDMTVEYWRTVAKNINSVLSSEENDDCSMILSLSYRQLAVHLKPCFLYMGIFREDSEIRASRIVKLWVAEGFIKPKGAQVVEEIAEGYLNDLVDRNLFLVGKHRSNGKIRSCRIHDLVRDVCIRSSEKEKFYCGGRALGIINRERRIIYHDFMSRRRNSEMFHALESAQFVRTLICRGLQLPVVFRLLRVLNMADDSSPEAALQNFNLRFLTYHLLGGHKSKLIVLPSSISLIWNLQTLAIHGESIKLVVAPLEIWNLPQLRHVECKRIYLPDPPENDDLVVLENLRTLINAVNLRLSEEVCRRIPNINKLHVIYDDSLEGYDDCLFDHLHNLGRLHKLQSLKVVTTLDHSPPSNADWLKCTFPRSLHKLSLTNGHLDWKGLTIIGSLPHLEVLKVKDAVVGHNWSPVCGEFLRLKSLSIANCGLRCWSADNSHFPVLKKLHLVGLWNLKEIPLGFGDIPTLELIRVEESSESAANSAMEIKEEQESLGNDGLQVQVQEDEVFKRKRSLKEKIRVSLITYKAALQFIDHELYLERLSEKSLDYL